MADVDGKFRYYRTDLLAPSSLIGTMLQKKQDVYAMEHFSRNLALEFLYLLLLSAFTIFFFGTASFCSVGIFNAARSSDDDNQQGNWYWNDHRLINGNAVLKWFTFFLAVGLLIRKVYVEYIDLRILPYITGVSFLIRAVRWIHFGFTTVGFGLYFLFYNVVLMPAGSSKSGKTVLYAVLEDICEDTTTTTVVGSSSTTTSATTNLDTTSNINVITNTNNTSTTTMIPDSVAYVLYWLVIIFIGLSVLTCWCEVILWLAFTSWLGTFCIIITRMLVKDLPKIGALYVMILLCGSTLMFPLEKSVPISGHSDSTQTSTQTNINNLGNTNNKLGNITNIDTTTNNSTTPNNSTTTTTIFGHQQTTIQQQTHQQQQFQQQEQQVVVQQLQDPYSGDSNLKIFLQRIKWFHEMVVMGNEIEHGAFHENILPRWHWLSTILMNVVVIVCYVMCLNMLIAMLTETYLFTVKEAKQIWLYRRAEYIYMEDLTKSAKDRKKLLFRKSVEERARKVEKNGDNGTDNQTNNFSMREAQCRRSTTLEKLNYIYNNKVLKKLKAGNDLFLNLLDDDKNIFYLNPDYMQVHDVKEEAKNMSDTLERLESNNKNIYF